MGDMTAFELNEFYQQLSRIMLFLGENKAAIQAAECCIENSSRGGVEVTPSSQLLFRAYLLSGNIEKAGAIADKAIRYLSDSGDPNGGIWYLFKSAFFFIQNMFRESYQVLITQEQHFNGNLPQKTFAKFFELIDILELGDLQWFEYKAESFRKRMERINLKEMDRIKQLYDLLKIAAIKSFPDYRNSSDKISPSLAFFDSQPIQWDPLGYEVINLGEWIRKRV
jgi:tetratricopeptide (TPR) repeat protein